MSTELFTLALFLIPLFLIGAFLITGGPVAISLQNYFRNRGRQSVTCPGSGKSADVTVDRKFAFQTALRGQEHSRLESCSRWPEKGDCGQECLAEIEPSPENIERLLTKWYEGKSCAICALRLSPSDWRRNRLAVLNADNKIFELREMTLDRLQASLENMRPLCWTCHQEERARQPMPVKRLKGERPVITADDLA